MRRSTQGSEVSWSLSKGRELGNYLVSCVCVGAVPTIAGHFYHLRCQDEAGEVSNAAPSRLCSIRLRIKSDHWTREEVGSLWSLAFDEQPRHPSPLVMDMIYNSPAADHF